MPHNKMRRGVLLMDVHGVFLSAEDPSQSGSVLVGSRRHQKWVDVVRTVLEEAGALPLQIKEALLDPCVCWGLRMRLELTTPKTENGQVVPSRKFQERVNLRLLRQVAPTFMDSLALGACRRLARQVRKLRRDAARHGYILEPEMRELVHWLAKEDRRWMLYLTTAGSPEVAEQELHSQNVPRSLFVRIFTTDQVSLPKPHPDFWMTIVLPKSHPDFWMTIAKKAQTAPDQCVVIEDNLVMGLNAAKAGMSVIFLDREYGIEEFIRTELKGQVAGVGLSKVGASLPTGHGQQFVVCAKSPAGIKLCLERIKGAPGGGP